VFKFWEISDNISETVQDIVQETFYNGIQIENHAWPIEWHDCQ